MASSPVPLSSGDDPAAWRASLPLNRPAVLWMAPATLPTPADRRRRVVVCWTRQRLAGVRPASRVAVVRSLRPVVDCALTSTVVATPLELGVERVEHVGVERAELHVPDQQPDVLVHIPDDRRAGAALPRAHRETAVEQLVHRRVGPAWLSSRVRASSASFEAFGPGAITSTRSCRRLVTGRHRRRHAPAAHRSAAHRSCRVSVVDPAGLTSCRAATHADVRHRTRHADHR